MIDIKFLRENPDVVRENIRKKFQDAKLPLVDEVITLDEELRASKKRAEVRPASAGSFSTDEFVSLALKKSYGTEEENAAPRAHSTSEYVTHALKKTYGIEDEKSSSNDEFLELPLFDEVKNEPFEEDHTYDTSEIFALVARRLTDENNKNKA